MWRARGNRRNRELHCVKRSGIHHSLHIRCDWRKSYVLRDSGLAVLEINRDLLLSSSSKFLSKCRGRRFIIYLCIANIKFKIHSLSPCTAAYESVPGSPSTRQAVHWERYGRRRQASPSLRDRFQGCGGKGGGRRRLRECQGSLHLSRRPLWT